MFRASIDIGSNTTLLLIAKIEHGKIVSEENYQRVTQLGREVQKTGKFHEESLALTYEALKEYTEIADQKGIAAKDIYVTATEASRIASNAPDFYKKVLDELGLTVTIISGAQEALFTAQGVCLDYQEDDFVIMDIGGASTELIKGKSHPFQITQTISMPMGAVKMKEWLAAGTQEQELSKIFTDFDTNPYKTKKLIAVAGTMTALAQITQSLPEFDEQKIQNYKLAIDELRLLEQGLERMSADETLEKYAFLGKRSQTIHAGAKIAHIIGVRLGISQYQISIKGLRHGSLLSSL